MKLKLDFSECLLDYLDTPLSPSEIYPSFGSELEFSKLLEKVSRESFKRREIRVVELLKLMVDRNILPTPNPFKVPNHERNTKRTECYIFTTLDISL